MGSEMLELLNKMLAIQAHLNEIDEKLRKTSNSVNVVARAVAGMMQMDKTQFLDILTEAQANTTTVLPAAKLDIRQALLNQQEYIVKISANTLKAIVPHIAPETPTSSPINPINVSDKKDLLSTAPRMSPIQPAQTQNASVKSLDTEETTKKTNCKLRISPIPVSPVPLIDRRSEREELRRKYRNRYKYMNIVKNNEQTHNNESVVKEENCKFTANVAEKNTVHNDSKLDLKCEESLIDGNNKGFMKSFALLRSRVVLNKLSFSCDFSGTNNSQIKLKKHKKTNEYNKESVKNENVTPTSNEKTKEDQAKSIVRRVSTRKRKLTRAMMSKDEALKTKRKLKKKSI